jgi:hypothetical protein
MVDFTVDVSQHMWKGKEMTLGSSQNNWLECLVHNPALQPAGYLDLEYHLTFNSFCPYYLKKWLIKITYIPNLWGETNITGVIYVFCEILFQHKLSICELI